MNTAVAATNNNLFFNIIPKYHPFFRNLCMMKGIVALKMFCVCFSAKRTLNKVSTQKVSRIETVC